MPFESPYPFRCRGNHLSLSSLLLQVFAVLLVFSSMGGRANAQSLVVPNLTESDATSGLSTPFDAVARTYMGYIDASQFASLTSPTLLTGMQFRLAIGTNSGVTANWPSQTLTFSQYDIQLAQASAGTEAAGGFLDATSSFASNQNTATLVNVRTGGLTVNTGDFPLDGGVNGVNSFGPVISFTTPYLYTPGASLTYLISQSGYTNGSVDQAFFASTDYVQGVADALESSAGTNAAAPTGYSQPLFVQFQTTTVPEPGMVSLLLSGSALFGTLALRRRRFHA